VRDLPDGLFCDFAVQSVPQKYSSLSPTQITSISPAIPSRERGVAHVTDVGCGMRWTRAAPLTNGADADGEVVWS
jgi:hypothetical protein